MKLKRFDVVDFLDSDEALVEYLNVALEENDPKYFAKALGNVARAKGMSSVSPRPPGWGGSLYIGRSPVTAIHASTRCSGFSMLWRSSSPSPGSWVNGGGVKTRKQAQPS